MSQLLINQYLNQLQDLRKVSGTHRESVVREAFKDLLKAWARPHSLFFVAEYEIAAPTRERRYVDCALVHPLRMPFGYWEAKDEKTISIRKSNTNSVAAPRATTSFSRTPRRRF